MGVASDYWFDRVLLDSLHVQTLAFTDVETPFLGTPLVPSRIEWPGWSGSSPQPSEHAHLLARRGLSPISLLRLSLLRFVDSEFPENYLWVWEFHPPELRSCLSQTL